MKATDFIRGFTVWVAEANLTGTHHVSFHRIGDLEEAKALALDEAASDWGHDPETGKNPSFSPDRLVVLGVALGNIHLVEWQENYCPFIKMGEDA